MDLKECREQLDQIDEGIVSLFNKRMQIAQDVARYKIENGRLRKFTLRSSMRALEEQLQSHGLVRCHRSYFVNPARVKMVKKDAGGYALASLDREGVEPVPVSKRYYEALSALL